MTCVRVPANVDTADKVLFGLTVRQIVLLAPVAVVVLLLWHSLQGTVPTLGLLLGFAPVAAVATGLVLGQRDGTSLDRLALAALRHPRRPLAPGRIDSSASLHATMKSRQVRVGALRGPVQALSDDGVLNLGTNGHAVALDASTVNFALRSDGEQTILTEGFARILHSLSTKLHIVVSNTTTDVTDHVARVRNAAERLREPTLMSAAHGYAAWLGGLGGSAVTRKLVTVVVTAPTRQAAERAADAVADGCAAIGVACTRLDAANLAHRIRCGVDAFPQGGASS